MKGLPSDALQRKVLRLNCALKGRAVVDAANSQFAAADDLLKWVITTRGAVSPLRSWAVGAVADQATDRKSTRVNSSHQ